MGNPIQKRLNINPASLNAYSSGLLQGIAYSRLHNFLTQALNSFGVSIPEWKLLGQVHERGQITLTQLAQHLDYDPPMVTKLAKLLEKKELIKRLTDTTDERSKFITITAKGNKLIRDIEPEVKKTMGKILYGVSSEELLVYIKVLTKIVDNTNK